MNTTLNEFWLDTLRVLDHAFQPVIRFADGSAYGFEALLRGWDEAGFSSIADVFDRAFEERVLYALDLGLRAKAFAKFAAAGLRRAKLFYNVDNRLLQMPDYSTGNTLRLAREVGLTPSRIVIEISELHDPKEGSNFDRVLAAYKGQGLRIALDDFGSGYAGFKLLHRAEPDIIKIDRFFVSGAAGDPRKAAFLGNISGMAHLMGIGVVAEGIETEEEFRLCAEAGCDYAQGFHIARPEREAGRLKLHYAPARVRVSTDGSERRAASKSGVVSGDSIASVRPLRIDAGFQELLERFRKEPSISIIPVIDEEGEAVGVYRERDFRAYVYSPFGISILEHLAVEQGGPTLVMKSPVAPLGSDLARIVELYGASPESGCVILTEGGRYAGLIHAEALLSLVAEHKLVEAREQNPLTRLPGNLRIDAVCAERLASPGKGVAFAYFDFDNFKPFNDRYGFRNGDRVIMLFADILRSRLRTPGDFVGHLGGDDFFACVERDNQAKAIAALVEVATRFAREATSFYSAEDRDRGWIIGMDRDGQERKMELITASLAVVYLEFGGTLDAETLSESLAALKKAAKASPSRLAVRTFSPDLAMKPAPSPMPEKGIGRPEPIFKPSLIASF